MDTETAAKWLCLSPRTLERYRLTGEGPKFVKFGRRVAYRLIDLEEYVKAHIFDSTSEHSVRRKSRFELANI